MIFVAGVRIRLLNIPLERDEGEYAYSAERLLAGIPPYAESYDPKMPGLHLFYAVFLALFGRTAAAIRIGLLLVNLASVVLIFILGRRLAGTGAGATAAAAFAVTSLSQRVFGFTANAEPLLLLPVLGGTVLLLRAREYDRNWDFFWCGFLFGCAFLIKQCAAAFGAFAALYLLLTGLPRPARQRRRFLETYARFLTGLFLPFGLCCLLLLLAGTFRRFWFWTFVYAYRHVVSMPLSFGRDNLLSSLRAVTDSTFLIWALAAAGLILQFLDGNARRRSAFVSLFLLFSFLAMAPGLYFRPHYFLLLLPAIAMLAGIAFASTKNILARAGLPAASEWFPALLTAVIVLSPVPAEWNYLFRLSPRNISRATYGLNPFPEAQAVAEYIRGRSRPEDRIAVLGSEPEIYFYARRRSAARHVVVYPLMKNHASARKMQEEMIADIERTRPEFIVFVNVWTSWLAEPGADRLIFDWFESYSRKYYRKVGVVDLIDLARTEYRWDREAADYAPRSASWLAVYQKAFPGEQPPR